jgi:hypothetical protein
MREKGHGKMNSRFSWGFAFYHQLPLNDYQLPSFDAGHGNQQPRGYLTTSNNHQPVVLHLMPVNQQPRGYLTITTLF